MKSISITKSEVLYEIVTLHQVPDGYYVSGKPKFIIENFSNNQDVIDKIKFCLNSSQKNYKSNNDEDTKKENENFRKEVVKKSGYKTYNKFSENSKYIIINQEKKCFKINIYYYDLKKKAYFFDKSKEIIELHIKVDDNTFFEVITHLLTK